MGVCYFLLDKLLHGWHCHGICLSCVKWWGLTTVTCGSITVSSSPWGKSKCSGSFSWIGGDVCAFSFYEHETLASYKNKIGEITQKEGGGYNRWFTLLKAGLPNLSEPVAPLEFWNMVVSTTTKWLPTQWLQNDFCSLHSVTRWPSLCCGGTDFWSNVFYTSTQPVKSPEANQKLCWAQDPSGPACFLKSFRRCQKRYHWAPCHPRASHWGPMA